jgi:hypothetical protein
MNDQSQQFIETIGIFVLATAVVITIIRQVAISRRARAQLVRESEYKKVAEAAVTGQQNIERQLAEIGGQVSDLRSRTDSIERVLKAVE